METITLEQIHHDLVNLKNEMEHLRTLIQEDYELSDDVVGDIVESRRRPKQEFISHEEIKKEFG